MNKNPKNAGRKKKFKPGIATKEIRPLIPVNKETEILKSIDKITKEDQL